jgi:hypothetical protein
MGYAKWAVAIAFISPKTAVKFGKKWNIKDRKEATELGKGLYRCMQVSMCLKK